MNLLAHVTADEPVGAAALLGLGDPDDLAAFRSLEDRVWDATTLAAATLESVRVRCADLRGCAFCASVRMSGAVADGLTEAELARQGDPDADADATLPADRRAALVLVRAYLVEAAPPPDPVRADLLAALGPAGVVEVLVACAAFASADLRIALGDNRPARSTLIPREHQQRPRPAGAAGWPVLDGPVLSPTTTLPHLAPALAAAVADRRARLLTRDEVPGPLLAACAVRSAQLLGAPDRGPVADLLAPPDVRGDVDPTAVRDWTRTMSADERVVMAFAEQLWVDPAGLDATVVAPARVLLGDPGLVRLTWDLIWIAQLQRLAAVLGTEVPA